MSPRAIILWDSFRLGAVSDTPRSATRQAAPPNRVKRAGPFGSGAVPVGNFCRLFLMTQAVLFMSQLHKFMKSNTAIAFEMALGAGRAFSRPPPHIIVFATKANHMRRQLFASGRPSRMSMRQRWVGTKATMCRLECALVRVRSRPATCLEPG